LVNPGSIFTQYFKVYAVEASTLAPLTKKNIEKNGYSDVITVINDRMENIELPEGGWSSVIFSWEEGGSPPQGFQNNFKGNYAEIFLCKK
jgi:protein-L-isoaspartate O-methyltransferase